MENAQELTLDEVYDIISIAHMTACMEYEEPLYNSNSNGRRLEHSGEFVPVECEQLAFNDIMKQEEILAYFQKGMVEDEGFLEMWEVYKANQAI